MFHNFVGSAHLAKFGGDKGNKRNKGNKGEEVQAEHATPIQ
jgi:hypothetical protein